MPDISRIPLRMDCTGIDLVHPIDKMPPGSFPYLFNARVLVEGRLDGRPGYTLQSNLPSAPNSIRRLNDPAKLYSPNGYTYLGGVGDSLYSGLLDSYGPLDTGYSGNPLSLIPFRPDQSPESWMYVYDSNKQVKVRPDGLIREIGIAPPTRAPSIEYGIPAFVNIAAGQSASGWSTTGASSSPGLQDRTNSSAPTIAAILYNSGNTGWACINPVITQPFWMGIRMAVLLSSEEVVVREIHNAITATTVSAIQYDSGSTGLCSLVFTNNPTGLDRNSLIQIGSETVRVLEVILSPDGTVYSVRCSTLNTHVAGESITGLLSWYVYTTLTHSIGESISSHNVGASQLAAGVGSLQQTVGVNASIANGRPIDPANDYLHISLFFQNPQNVTNVQLLLSLDSTPNFSFTNPGNSLIWTIPATQLDTGGSSGNAWAEVVVPISAAVRSGVDLTRNLSNISGVAVQLTSTGACSYGFDWWYLFGTYGSVIQANSPVGTVYQTRFRDSTTGAHSVPGPQNRYELYPLRESVIVTPQISLQGGVDLIDIYREGGTVTSPLYVGTVPNVVAAPSSFTDTQPVSVVLSYNQPPDLTAIQPWSTLGVSWSGTVTVIGTTVIWQSGTPFNTNLISNTIITINGVAYQTYGQPSSSTILQITQNAGYQAGVPFQVGSPLLAAQTLPYAFGPLEGPFAPVIFALGDQVNGDTLYFTNFSDADSAPNTNSLEFSSPSSDLVSGATYNGMAFVGSRDTVYCIRYSYLTTIGASSNTTYQWVRINAPSGMWCRWACCTTPYGVAYLGRDGIYLVTDNGATNITDEKLYPLFPHEGQPASQLLSGSNILDPVDMNQINYLRLSYCDEELRFHYKDTGGNWQTLILEIAKKRWMLNNYADNVTYSYLSELPEEGPNDQEIVLLAYNNKVLLAGGDTDAGQPINTVVLLPSQDGGDERSQNLYVDTMFQADGNGSIGVGLTFNNAQVFSTEVFNTLSGGISQYLVNVASLTNLTLYRNIGAKFAWTGGPDGPRLYAWETSGFIQPYVSTSFVTQFITLSFPGWKHMRRAYPAYIALAPINFTVQAQDGRVYGPFTLPSTSGQFRVIPQMLDFGIKDLAFAMQLVTTDFTQPFALFPQDFVVEVKEWTEEQYIKLALFRA